jgi:hypothetical protein
MMISTSCSILQLAVAARNLESVDLLVAHGANINYGAVMHVAVDGGSLDMMAHLLELGANIDQLDSLNNMADNRYGRPLLRAIAKGKTEAVKFLLENGASTTMKGHDGETAMDMVKNDWVVDEIRKMVEEVGERGPMGPVEKIVVVETYGQGTANERVVEKRESGGTEKDREGEDKDSGEVEKQKVEEKDDKGTEKDREEEERDNGGTEEEQAQAQEQEQE